jgi:hypothetical protein
VESRGAKRQPTSPAEMRALLRIVERDLSHAPRGSLDLPDRIEDVA